MRHSFSFSNVSFAILIIILLVTGGCTGKVPQKEKPSTLEEMQALSEDELFDLFIDNGLVVNDRLANTLPESEIKRMLKKELEQLIKGFPWGNDITYERTVR